VSEADKSVRRESSYRKQMKAFPLGVEVRAVCPACASEKYMMYGQKDDIVYRKCRDCGHMGKVRRYRSDEADFTVE